MESVEQLFDVTVKESELLKCQKWDCTKKKKKGGVGKIFKIKNTECNSNGRTLIRTHNFSTLCGFFSSS